MLNKLIAAAIISAGVGSMLLSAYWSALDYTALVQANQLLSAKTKTSSEREIQLLMHRENVHRLNVGFEGVWMGLGGIITAVGFVVGKSK